MVIRFCLIPAFPAAEAVSSRPAGLPLLGEGLLFWSNEVMDRQLGVASGDLCGLILARIVYLESSICSPIPLFFHLEESSSRGEAERGEHRQSWDLQWGGLGSHSGDVFFVGPRVPASGFRASVRFHLHQDHAGDCVCGHVGGSGTRTDGTCALVMLQQQGLGGRRGSLSWRQQDGSAAQGTCPSSPADCPRPAPLMSPPYHQRLLRQVPAPLKALPRCWKGSAGSSCPSCCS